MSWIDKIKVKTRIGKKIVKLEAVWVHCKGCGEQIYQSDLEKNYYVCPQCDRHFRIGAAKRVVQLLNPGTFVEYNQNLVSADPLKFKDKKKYKDRIRSSIKKGVANEAVLTGAGMLGEHQVELCLFEFEFMGGSMGSVVGEKITRSVERAIENRTPLIIISCSGGARMQEGILSLMQMAKTASVLRRFGEQGLPYISILTDPTTGGVSASFAMLGDIILAEPGALVGFAGPRVIEQTIKQKLPEGFQTSEFLFEHGLIDNVVHRRELKAVLENILTHLRNFPKPLKPKSFDELTA